MGKFYTANFTVEDPTSRATSISEWFNNLDGITSEVIDYEYSDSTYKAARIAIDNTPIEVLFGVKTTAANDTVVYAKNGDIYLINNTLPTGFDSGIGAVNAYAYIHENIVLIGIKYMANYASGTNNGIEVLYLKTSENRYLVGYYRNGTANGFADISSMTFEELSDSSRTPYTYANMFPYAATPPSLDFLTKAYFKNGLDYMSFTSDILKSCSEVSLLETASLPDPLGPHMAIGAHCIVPVDIDEEVSE